MNTNQLKKFAQEARKKLLEQVGAKLSFVLTTDSVELREKTEQVKQLREQLNKISKEQLIEKVAYTWFNRLMALRFMDANDYQPLGIRIITPKDGYTIPELLDEAKRGNIPEDLRLKQQKVYDLLDNRIPSANPQNEAFKELLIAACNHLNTTFPFLFEKINDYTELLLPDDLTSDFSIVTDIRKGMPVEDCKDVEIIGWLYQFYISEKKDEVFASKAKVKKEDIPAATQLFTPRWIVEYMVQNTLGKLWLQNRPKSKLREHMPYFIESASLKSDDYLKISSPEEIKLADPASGSGHILVYTFDLFTKIYEEEGYNTSDIPKLIIEKNLFGFEIDERAAQLSGLALMMKAREYQRRALKKDLQPNILCFQDSHLDSNEIRETLNSLNINISDELMHDLQQMRQATNFGSLLIPHALNSEISNVLEKLNQLTTINDVFLRNKIDALLNAFNQHTILSNQFHCVVANPPYMGNGNMNLELFGFVKRYYPDSKADLMACFMESGLNTLFKNGYLGMINQHSWMFLSSYESLRKKYIQNVFIDSLLHLGARTFPEIGGEVVQNAAFTIWNNPIDEEGKYIRLVDYESSELKRSKTIEAIQNNNSSWYYVAKQKQFAKIPKNPIGYWLTRQEYEVLNISKSVSDYAEVRGGMTSGNNSMFVRQWYEITFTSFGLNLTKEQAIRSNYKWFPYNKGGSPRKWFGNQEAVIDWYKDGINIKEYKLKQREKNPKYNIAIAALSKMFRSHLSWSLVTGSSFSVRKYSQGFLFDVAGSAIFTTDDLKTGYLHCILNSNISKKYLSIFNPTINFQPSNVSDLPILEGIFEDSVFINLEISLVNISTEEWNMREISWDFHQNEFIRISGSNAIELQEVYDLYKQYWTNKFFQLHKNEEELNIQFSKIYGLETELLPYIPLEEITILQEELDRQNLKTINSKLIRDPKTLKVKNYDEITLPFVAKEIIAQFISYSVGCMFGRYSLDKEGLILASQGDISQDYFHKVSKQRNECTFLPDEDNIIPILEDDWFDDDIVERFNNFLKVAFGDNNFNKNIAFIEEHLGKNIRNYFIKDFYPDHIKRYKKRPIYWIFTSPNGSFNALIYLHRYTPDTVSNILNKYLKEFIGKLNTRKEHLQHIQISGSPAEKNRAIKENDNIDKMLIELQEYERDVLYPLATERIAIDLDDGVLVNYNKFGKAVKEVKGLNDNKTKDKIRKFDWIDTTQIR